MTSLFVINALYSIVSRLFKRFIYNHFNSWVFHDIRKNIRQSVHYLNKILWLRSALSLATHQAMSRIRETKGKRKKRVEFDTTFWSKK